MKTLWISVSLFCFAFVLNSCTSDKEKTAHQVHTIIIKQMQFLPKELSVYKGDTIVWINQDIVAHDVTEENKKAWSSSTLAPGKSWSMVAKQSADYYCSIHVVMKGKLLVE